MTKREQDIFRIIEKDPFVSQNEIAEKLEISRSAVSVYLNTMYKKGLIRGRGYIISKATYPLLIGPSHIDIRSVCQKSVSGGVYSSAKTQITHGGPIKNIAEYLIGLEIFPKAIFAVAADAFGSSFSDSCQRMGLDISASVRVSGASSPVYTEMVDESLQLIAASFATDNLSSHITPEHLHAQFDILENASVLVLHDSVPPESVEYLRCCKAKSKLMLVSSNSAYTAPVADKLGVFDMGIFPYYVACGLVNGLTQERAAEANADIPKEMVQEVCTKLFLKGMNQFYLFINTTTLCYCNGEKILLHTSCNPQTKEETPFRAYMNCRDIFAAVVTYCFENGLEEKETLDLLASARNSVLGGDSYFGNGINEGALQDGARQLQARMEEIKIK